MVIKKEIAVQLPKAESEDSGQSPVLIVGGGPVGLSASLMLSYHGVRSLLVEQHPGTTVYPKARLINARTMEIFRQLGLEGAVRTIAIPHTHDLILTTSLAAKELARFPAETVNPEPVREWSPTWGCTITQEVLEPVLLSMARQSQLAHFQFSTQLASFTQFDDGVQATLLHRPSGRVRQVRARFLIGADGSHSTVRDALGIRLVGEPVLKYYVNILFRADLSPWTRDREINIASIINPQAPGLLLYNGADRWRFSTFYYPEKGQRPEDFTPEYCTQLIRIAVGALDLTVALDDIKPWNDAALVAEHFSDRRVFLAGDATHQMSPMGGFGMNVGIQDAHNLAWKLAAVLGDYAAPALLETYETERQPVSRAIVEQMVRNSQTLQKVVMGDGSSTPATPQAHTQTGRPELGREHGLVFGAIYDSAAIVADDTSPVQLPDPVHNYTPGSRPGSRAPHVWLERQGQRLSTLDLFGRQFTLLAGGRGQTWCEAARSLSESLHVPIQAYTIGSGGELADPGSNWATTYGVDQDGAVLIRPDGYVAWRTPSMKAEPGQEIKLALLATLGFQPIQQLQNMQHV